MNSNTITTTNFVEKMQEKKDEEEYECYCMECGEVIEGMTEEEFTGDDEIKLCKKCDDLLKTDSGCTDK